MLCFFIFIFSDPLQITVQTEEHLLSIICIGSTPTHTRTHAQEEKKTKKKTSSLAHHHQLLLLLLGQGYREITARIPVAVRFCCSDFCFFHSHCFFFYFFFFSFFSIFHFFPVGVGSFFLPLCLSLSFLRCALFPPLPPPSLSPKRRAKGEGRGRGRGRGVGRGGAGPWHRLSIHLEQSRRGRRRQQRGRRRRRRIDFLHVIMRAESFLPGALPFFHSVRPSVVVCGAKVIGPRCSASSPSHSLISLYLSCEPCLCGRGGWCWRESRDCSSYC